MRSLVSALVVGAFVIHAPMAYAEEPVEGDIWPSLRAQLFGTRVIEEDSGTRLELNLPKRAHDAGVVPLEVRFRRLPGDPQLRKLYLVIDENPSPVGAIFEFGEASGGVEFETRVRIEDYTWVRVIAERDDGSLISTRRFIKAAGGCSAPAGKTLAERMAGIGRMKWRLDQPQVPGAPSSVQLMIRHPNDSGLAMDQLTRLYDPPMFVNHVRVMHGGAMIFDAQVDFTISQNPVFRFTLPFQEAGLLQAVVTDTDNRRFESTFEVTAPGSN